MERLEMEKMENLVGGSDYCENLGASLFGGQFQGSLDLFEFAMEMYETHCED